MYTLNVYVSVCMCSECGCPQRPEEGIKVHGAGVTRDCEPPIHVGAWNRTQVLIREQQMALSIKSSRQLLSFTLWKHLLLLLYQHPWREKSQKGPVGMHFTYKTYRSMRTAMQWQPWRWKVQTQRWLDIFCFCIAPFRAPLLHMVSSGKQNQPRKSLKMGALFMCVW